MSSDCWCGLPWWLKETPACSTNISVGRYIWGRRREGHARWHGRHCFLFSHLHIQSNRRFRRFPQFATFAACFQSWRLNVSASAVQHYISCQFKVKCRKLCNSGDTVLNFHSVWTSQSMFCNNNSIRDDISILDLGKILVWPHAVPILLYLKFTGQEHAMMVPQSYLPVQGSFLIIW